MQSLPLELLDIIAAHDVKVYRALLLIPLFGRGLNPQKIIVYKKIFTVTKTTNGWKEWSLNGKLHREDGPAVEWPDGTKSFWRHGKLHREDGPAVEYVNGDKAWYRDGERHRKNGPVFELATGIQSIVPKRMIYRLCRI